jgi:lysozyme
LQRIVLSAASLPLFYDYMDKKKTTSRKRKTAADTLRTVKPRSKGKKRKKHTHRETPAWVRIVVAIFIFVAILSFIYVIFIRPYAYRWKPCQGMKAYGICVPCCYDVHGIDVSHYQGNIDWDAVKRGSNEDFPIEFVFMKATEGGDLADEAFAANFENAGKCGFIRGAYHFFSPKTDPQKQADYFINNVHLCSGDLPPVLDVETVGKGKDSQKRLRDNVLVWLQRVESHYGVKPIIYASYKFTEKYLNDSIFNTYPYWIAHYYVDSVRYEGKWQFWQHSDVGTVPGIDNDVDLNVFNGTLEDLRALTLK